ncbi:hypothetical protein N431DRAFT_504089 [Stipitochalara longipes BDJ]|nr:hypothetical protein N431DRAFT_504089 [Stipitochalara longipes BDJ]
MQLTLLTPILLLLTSIHAIPTPEDSSTSSNAAISSTDDTDHYPYAAQNPVVATVDLWKSGGCQPQICNHNFLVNLNGCTVVPKGCSTSAKVTTGSDNCYFKIWTDDRCSSQKNVITVKKEWGGIGQCEQPGPQIGSISAVCH